MSEHRTFLDSWVSDFVWNCFYKCKANGTLSCCGIWKNLTNMLMVWYVYHTLQITVKHKIKIISQYKVMFFCHISLKISWTRVLMTVHLRFDRSLNIGNIQHIQQSHRRVRLLEDITNEYCRTACEALWNFTFILLMIR